MHKVNFYFCLKPKTTGRATALSNVFFFQRLTINIIVISQKTVVEFDNRNRSSLGCTKMSNIFTFPGKLENILEHDTI